jgi:hypothetical protein
VTLTSLITLHYPGAGLGSDHDTTRLVSLVEAELVQAAVCLRAFVTVVATPALVPQSPVTYAETADLDELIRREEARAAADRDQAEHAREAFAAGELPPRYRFRLMLTYARGFVESLRIIKRALGTIAKRTGVDLAAILESLNHSQPHLTGVRDSSAHRDERALRRANNKPIGGRHILLERLTGNVLAAMVEDGRVGEVVVNESTLNQVVEAVQKAIDRLPWTGGPREFYF